MEITRQLRLDKLTKAGFAPVQLTVWWANQRLREATGERVRPEHWDEEKQEVAPVKGSYYADINARLRALTSALERAQQDADTAGVRLTPAQVKAVLARAKRAKAPAAAATPPLPAAGFDALYRRWAHEHAQQARPGTGRPLSATAVAGLEATRVRLAAYAEARGVTLAVERLDMAFYQDLRAYVTGELGQSVNTFGKHIDRLKTFLAWGELELDLPVHRHYRKFVAPRKRGRVDALTEDELRRVAGLDFTAPAVHARLLELRAQVRRMDNKREEWSAERWVAHVALARDKFLLCCYTGLRISDANRAAWQHVHGQVLVVEAQKNQQAWACYIPFYDDELFQPVALASRYPPRSPLDLLVPECYRANEFLRVVQQLAGLTRLKLTTKIGRKTFVTLKLYQGVPTRLVMQATGHQTEESFNHYVGVDTIRLLEEFMRKSARKRAA